MLKKLLFLLASLTLAVGAQAQSRLVSPNTPPTQVTPDYTMPAGKIYIDLATIPKPRLNFSTIRIKKTSGSCGGTGTFTTCDNGVDAPNKNGNGDSGSFRINCGISHFSFDDPIVWPGQPGKTHLHEFAGNQSTSAASDAAHMEATGNSACPGGILNRTGYWFPPLVYHCPAALAAATASGSNPCDPSREGHVLPAWGANFYYKTQGTSITARHAKMIWPPAGFRMISGNASNTEPGSTPVQFVCNPADPFYYMNGVTSFHHFPSKADADAATAFYNSKGGTGPGCTGVEVLQNFPGCWNGIDLYIPSPAGSPTNAHLSYVDGNGDCSDPAFPVMIPVISYNYSYDIPNANDLDYYRLSSDQPRLSATGTCAQAQYNWCAGASIHGDWDNGWDQTTPMPIPGHPGNTLTVTQAIMNFCLLPPPSPSYPTLHPGTDCHNNLIGAPQDWVSPSNNPFEDNAVHDWFTLY